MTELSIVDHLDSFGEWLRQRRERLGQTRAELAECAGCSVSALRKIEADERRPSRQLAELLADCLRIAPEEQASFLDAARGLRRVERLGSPEPARVAISTCARPPASAWNLPAPATPLLGREAELATLGQLLGDPGCRLLTLVGPGGIGKTRLALEALCFQWEYFADGVFFASLASVASAEYLVPAIAQVIGFNFSGPADPRHQLVNYLRHKQVLLLLDNLEHLLEGVELLAELLERAPALKLLATSRQRLELQGEWVFEVQGLPVPAGGEVEGVESYSAVELFVQRARQAQVAFEMTAEERPAVVRICQLVEGMPLALELAAAWVPVLSCQEIANEIERGLDILATTMRDVPERQRSVQAVFDHSWHLLSPEERHALRQLAVFRGGFQREAAQNVAGASLPLLSALVAKSFLRRTSTGRFSMHELVLQYLASRLAEDPEEEMAARDRHSVYYTAFVAQLESELKGPRQLQALAEMDAEIDNIRAGWRWAVRHGKLKAVRQPMRALWYFYDIRGWFQEAESSLGWAAGELDSESERHEEPDGSARTLPQYLRALQGWFYLRLGKLRKAELLLQSSLSSLRSFATGIELADVLYYVGAATWMNGDYARARGHFLEELAVAERFGNQWDVGQASIGMGLVAQMVGEYEEARQHWQRALAIYRSLGDQRGMASALHFSSILERMLGAHAEAQARLRECLALSESVGDRVTYGMALSQLGLVTQALGDHAEAVGLLNESVALLRGPGELWSLLHALIGLGEATLAVGEYAASRAAYCEALALAWERQALPEALEVLIGLARWSTQHGAREEMQQAALTSILFVLNHPVATDKMKDEARQLWSELELLLGAEQAEVEEARAQNISLEALVTSLLAPAPGQRRACCRSSA